MSIKYTLVLCFGLEKLLDFYQHASDLSSYETIQLINLTLALTFGSIYAACYFKQFIMAVFYYKIFLLRNSNAIIRTMNYLKKTKTLPNNISFIFYPITNFDKKGSAKVYSKEFDNSFMPVINGCTNAECKLQYLLMLLIITVMNEKRIETEFLDCFQQVLCTRHYQMILEEQPNLSWPLFEFLLKNLDK